MLSAGLHFCRSLGHRFNHDRVIAYSAILLAIEIGCFLFLVAGTHGLIVPLDTPTSTDFVSFYAAGSLADAGRPELAYDQAAHRAAEERATAPGVEYRFFYYPITAGLLFGALCYKPHFGLLIPLALAAGGHWRAFAAALASAGALCLFSLMLFGWATWNDFLSAAAASHATYESGRIAFGGLVSPFGAVLLLGGTSPMAYAVQAGATISAGLLVGFVWRSGFALPIRAATLAAATLIAIPVILIYDLTLAGVAAAWLVRAREGDEIPSWEKAALAGSLLLLLNPRGLAEMSHIPIAPLVALALVAVVTTRVFVCETRAARVATA